MNLLARVVAATDPSLITVGGLPLHPLAVHVVVVLLPLSALALVALIIRPSLRPHYAWPMLLGLLAGVGATVVAVQAGEQLAVITGISEEHRTYGKWLEINALVLLAVAAIWAWDHGVFWGKGVRSIGRGRVERMLAAVPEAAAIALAALSVVLTALVGHSGASAVWSGRITTPAPSPSPTATLRNYTVQDLQQHATTASCWTAIDGKAYDLTDWIMKHPGGPGVIEAMCGRDGSAAFAGQHAGQSRPAGYLAGYQIGTIR